MNLLNIPGQRYCSMRAAARALGVSTRKVVDLLVMGELKGRFGFPGKHKLGRTLVKVATIHAFIERGDAQ